eukprot:GHVL01027662.1.p1 GENE.GHVL01027662.1~~GHVL01027662.1.p1  ORF type:complete len:289 (+),score=47.60 GHVL01027662.1:39-905(+)
MYDWRVQALLKALEKAGKRTGPLKIEDLTTLGHLDQYHYRGIAACDDAISLLNPQPGSTILDVGSGIGGPARYIAAKTNSKIIGVELQSQLVTVSKELTDRIEDVKDVEFICGDILEIPPIKCRHLLSLLVILHIENRKALFTKLYDCLEEGGTFLIEDFVTLKELTDEEKLLLVDVVGAPAIPSEKVYIKQIEDAGFIGIKTISLSDEWKIWTKNRYEKYENNKMNNIQLFGQECYDKQVKFYRTIAQLFAGDRLGGILITGWKGSESSDIEHLKTTRLDHKPSTLI